MVVAADVYAFALLVAVAPALALARVLWPKRNKPGGQWLVATLVGMAGWSASWGLLVLFDSEAMAWVSLTGVVASVGVTVVGWAMLSLEFTRQSQVPARRALPLFAVPAVTVGLAATNWYHGLVWGPGTEVMGSVVALDTGPWFAVHSVYAFGLMAASGLLLVRELLTAGGVHRKQVAVLLAGWCVPMVTSIGYNLGLFGVSYVNPTPLAFLLAAGVWGWGLYRFQLLEIVPLARRIALDEMDEAVLIADDEGRIADVNEAAGDWFGFREDPTGEPVVEALAAHPELVETYELGVEEATIPITCDGERRYLHVNRTEVGRDDAAGTVLVYNDVTALKRHEHDLDLMRQVLARVLRHDIGNDLNVIRAHGELLASEAEGSRAENARTIVRKCDDVIATSKKARAIEGLVESDRPRYDVDVVEEVEQVVEGVRDRYPDARIETDLPTQAWVRADSKLELAVQSLVENAVQHSDAEYPWVGITVRSDTRTVTVVVEDDGPGLDENERAVFERRQIDQLSHSRGLGLWLVDWVVRNSDAEIEIDTGDGGTRFEITLERCLEPHPAEA